MAGDMHSGAARQKSALKGGGSDVANPGGLPHPKPLTCTASELGEANRRMFESLLGKDGLLPDIGKLELLCEARLHERFLLVEADLLVSRSFVRLARRRRPGTVSAPDWVLACIDRTIDELLVESESRLADPLADSLPPGPFFEALMDEFGVKPAQVHRASHSFNGAAEEVRRTFFLVVRQQVTLAECESLGLGSRGTVIANLRIALERLLLCGESGKGGSEMKEDES